MSAATKKATVSPQRRGMYAKINIGRNDLGWATEFYRDWLEQNFGKTSLKQLTFAELEDALSLMKEAGFKTKKAQKVPQRAGRKRLADGKVQRKARALWLSLYHLGVVRNPKEEALENHAKRICLGAKGNENVTFPLQAMTESQAYKVIESLKKMAEREAKVSWEGYIVHTNAGPTTVYNGRARVLEAQWRKISDHKTTGGLSIYATKFSDSPCRISYTMLDADVADRLIEHFGKKIREQGDAQ